jgi:hypothetical protein
MDIGGFSRAYARSPLGIGSLFLSLCAGGAAGFAGLSLPLAFLVGLGSLVLATAAGLALGLGQRAAVAEAEREALVKAESRLAEAAQARRRLSALRLSDGEVAGARDLVVLEAGRLVEDCRRAGTYDPEAVQAVLDSVGLVDAWLKEADESSVERRFDLADAQRFPEAARRTAEALRAKAALVSAGRAAALGELPGADRIAIEEELR